MAKIDFRKLDTYRKSFDGILQVKKHVGLEDDLPVTGAQNGDIYTVGDSNTLYMFNNEEWGTLGSAGVTSATVTVDESTGTPSASVSVENGVLSLSFSGLKGKQGPQGNTGSSVDYPYELVNNLTTDDATKGLSAAQGVVLDNKVSQLRSEVYGIDTLTLPEGLKALNWEQANHSRKIWYEDGSLNFKVDGVSGTNIAQANANYSSDLSCWEQVDADFWAGDTPLVLKVGYNIVQPIKISIGYKKGFSGSLNTSEHLITTTGEGETTIDVKALLKQNNSSSYSSITHITIHSMYAQGETYGVNMGMIYGFIIKEDGDIKVLEKRMDDVEADMSGKQATLVSAENIKTINGNDILGQGNLIISEGGVSLASVLQLRANLPSWYTEQPENPASYDDDSYIDVKTDSVPAGKKFIFFTDSHWDYYVGNPKTSPALITYVRNRLNIRNVIFGGDFIDVQDTKYLAKQVLGDFAYKCLSGFGSGILPVMGNHDNNLIGVDLTDAQAVETHYLPNNIIYDVLFRTATKPNGNYWDDNKTTLLQMAETAQFTDAEKIDLEAECRMDYWYDDAEQKIRYIIHKTETPHITPMWRLFGGATTPYLVWLYNVLCGTPEGYDVCLAVHMLGSPNTTPQVSDVPLRQLTSLLMGLKTRTAKEFYVSRSTDNCWTMWPWTRHTLDFTGCNEVGKVFVIAGHDHGDGISVANQSSSVFNNVEVSNYEGGIIDQETIQTNNGCSIPIIWTATNSLRPDNPTVKGDRPTATKDTITEQIFDVFSIQEDGIRITRVGAGSDRTLLING